MDQQLLNLDDDGNPLTNRTALKSTTAAETKYIQKVHGKLLYYAMQADPSLEPAVIDISKQLATPTQDTLSDTKRLLGYAVHNPNRSVMYTASDMEYRIQTSRQTHLIIEISTSLESSTSTKRAKYSTYKKYWLSHIQSGT